ncbi:transcription initiation factor IIF, beta subunit-domain-containing protein [Pyronema domesticum]|uniref:Transcription initiation factor IIF subunit beta n=1 Tax=Pyronema omphalodes (strain CBS 100304) TaxID=1076935 RepID=U4LLV2_PYROM|nr:transcription initiation factor IIF, beta subunit-domain-containing protein [Pyronema domesticum]CCX32913.1 Similar to Transcription initiation factor IIF subunit beta; acc. no. O94424 [Pyronema omphalodes CBS 100304]
MSAPIKLEPGSSSSSAAHIKQEPGVSHIKSENSQSPASAFNDDDELYEDAGDLDILAGQRAVWLVKLPQFLAERWKDIDEDEEIVLGTVRVDNQAPSDKQLKLFLEKNAINGEDIPREYDLNITNMEVTNTYVFTEQDMPGYESKMETGVKEGDPAIPARFLYQNRNRNDKDKGKNRFQPYVRKAIPKRTALVGTAKHECAVLPVYNDEYRQFQLNRTLKEDAPQYSTKFLDDTSVAGNLLMPGTTGNLQNSFTNFIKPTQPIRKANDNKSYRIARADLITQLFSHFSEHEYWSMKGFREVTNQPEAYLKEVLEDIAIMNRSGPYTGKWSLKEEFKQSGHAGASGMDPIDVDDDDDDEGDMEDVPLGK